MNRPDDFDETTPPPRARPRGVPLQRYQKLPAGEEIGPLFAQAEREGRIPPGCVLCRFHGTIRRKKSGYVLLAVADSVGGRDPMRKRYGDELTDEHLGAFRVAVEFVQTGAVHVIFAPLSKEK